MRPFASSTAPFRALAAGHQPTRAAPDGRLTREEALEVVRVPSGQAMGRAEAEQVQRTRRWSVADRIGSAS